MVASLARPGGNATGLSLTALALDAKRLQLLKEVVPNASRVAILAYAGDATMERDWEETRDAARALGLDTWRQDVRSQADFEGAFSTLAGEGAEILVVLPSNVLTQNRARLVNLAAQYRLPAMYEGRQFTDAGGFLSYGADLNDLYRRAAGYVDKILEGAEPANLPVEQPIKFDFVINLKTAQALGLTIPPRVLAQATELIQ